MQELYNKIATINTKEDFIGFLESLILNLKNSPQEWENASLETYLDAAARWTEDMEGYYQNKNLPMPQNVNWKVFAEILMAATMYE